VIRLRRRWLFVAAVLLFFFTALVVGSWLLSRDYGPRLARLAEIMLEGRLGYPVRVGDVAIRLWRGQLVISKVAVAAAGGWEKGTMLELDRVAATVGVSSLWRRELVVSRFQLKGLTLRLPGTGAGAPGALGPVMIPERLQLGPVTVAIRAIEIQQGHIFYRDQASHRDFELLSLQIMARPKGDALDATLGADALRVGSGGLAEELTRLRAEVRLEPRQLLIRRLAFRWDEREVAVGGKVGDLWTAPSLALEVRGALSLPALSRRAEISFPVEGLAQIDARLSGSIADPVVSAKIAVPNLLAGKLMARDLALTVNWRGETLAVEELSAEIFDGRLQGSLKTALSRLSETQANFTLKDASLARMEFLEPKPLGIEGKLDVEAELTGDPKRPADMSGRFRIEASRLGAGALGEFGKASLNASGRLGGRVVTIEQASGSLPGVEFDLSGQASLAGGINLRARLAADLARIVPGRKVTGQSRLAAELRGSLSAPEIAGQLEAAKLVIVGVPIDQVTAAYRFAGKTLEFRAARVATGESRAAASGRLTWSGAGLPDRKSVSEKLGFEIDLESSRIDLKELKSFLPEGARGMGAFAIKGRISGTPARWQGLGRFEAAELTVAGASLSDLRADLTVGADRIESDNLEVRLFGLPARVKFGWSWKGDGAARAEVGPLDLGKIARLNHLAPVSGTATARLAAKLSAGTVSASGMAQFDRLSIEDFALGPGSARLELQRGEAKAEFAFPDAKLSGTATGHLDGSGIILARLRLDEFGLERIPRRHLPERLADLEGSVSARATVSVPVDRPEGAKATIQLDPMRVVFLKERWLNSGPVTLRWEGGVLYLDRLRLRNHAGVIEASGTVEELRRVDMKLSGSFPLQWLPLVRAEIEGAEGSLSLSARLVGPLDAPMISGEGRVRDGQISLKGYPQPLRNFEAHIVLSPGSVRLVGASAQLAAGRITARGEIGFSEWEIRSYRLMFGLKNIAAELTTGLETVWDAELELVGQGATGFLRGEAKLVRGSYTRDLTLLSFLLEPTPGKDGGPGFSLPIQVLVKLENNLVVRNTLARFRVGGNLSLEGKTDSPVIFGTLRTDQGHFLIRRNRFNIVAATARFNDPRSVNPFLEVTAKSQIDGYDITMNLSGFADDLSVRFASTPPLPEEDLLSLVTFGVTRAGFAASPAGVLVGEAAQFLVEDLLGVRAARTGVDVLEMKTDGEGGRSLRVGRKLTERALVVYSQSLADTEQRRLRVEYQLFGPLLLAGEQNFRGGFGGDLVLRLRLR
jgi:hypothetical protein